jgi:hypothetical protein
MLIFSLFGCSKPKPIANQTVMKENSTVTRIDNSNTQRNANFMNGSILVKDQDWIYYIGSWGQGLYKIKIDGSEYLNLDMGSNLSHIILSGDRVYFFEQFNLLSIKKDGTDKKEINAQYKGQNLLIITTCIQQTNDWIYFKGQPLPIPINNNTNLYKMKLDGSSVTLLNEGEINSLNVTDDAIFFTDGTKNNAIMRCNLDGSNLQQINEEPSNSILVDGGSIYYLDGQNLLYRLNIRTKHKTQIGTDHIGSYNLLREWIYFINKNDHEHLYKMHIDGSNQKQINEYVTGSIIVYDGLVYYLNVKKGNQFYMVSTDEKIHRWIGANATLPVVPEVGEAAQAPEQYHTYNRISSGHMDVLETWLYVCFPVDEAYDLFRMKFDGSKVQMINSYTYLYSLSIIGDQVYYKHGSDRDSPYNGTLHKISIDEKNQKSVIDYPITDYLIQGDWIYYSSSARFQKLLKQNLKTGEIFSIFNGVAGSINLAGEWLYFVNYSDKQSLNKVRTNGKDAVKLVTEPVNSIMLYGDWIYYLNEKEELNRIKTDGTNKMPVGKNKINSYNLTEKWIYFINSDNHQFLYKMHLDGSNPTKLNSRYTDFICVFEEQVFYVASKDEYGRAVYRLLPDGSEQEIYNSKRE